MTKLADKFKHLPAFKTKMTAAGIHPVIIDTFAYYYQKVVTGETGLISSQDIEPVSADEVKDARRLKEYADVGRSVLKNAVMIKLNGGLGTSMGLTKAKSLLTVKNGKTFLEIILKQAEKYNVPLVLMNSFNTHEDTLAALSSIKPSDFPLSFLQNKFPKILQANLEPATWPKDPALEWNPPGHGDIYSAMYTSGMLKTLLQRGIHYAFISNSDNLGAIMDESLLGYFAENRFSFMMEVAPRTPSDVKGGHIARQVNGRLTLRESAQCPKEDLGAFQDINLYGFFNTNNLWINLNYLETLIEEHGSIQLPMIRNPKTLDPRDENSPHVYQIETAMGAAISLFDDASVIKVPASRFFPVKKCDGLLSVRSDRFVFTKDNHLILNPTIVSENIKITLDPKYYGKIDLFNERFFHGAPSLIDCESLTIDGDVRFESNVTIKGSVDIRNTGKSQATIKEGTVVDEDLIFN